MIIWGSTGKEKRVEDVEFYCPKCREQVEGVHLRMCRYFTLYFIPLFSLETLGEYVRCDECEGEFNLSVLDLTEDDVAAAVTPWKCDECGNRNPAEYDQCLSCKEPRT